MKTYNLEYEKTLWDICDMLAGSVNKEAAARAFIMAADNLAETGVTMWKESGEYQEAKNATKD